MPSRPSARHQRRGLMSGAGKPVEARLESAASPAEENQDALPSHPLGRYRKRVGQRTAEAQAAN